MHSATTVYLGELDITKIRTSFTIFLLVMSLLTTFPVSGTGGQHDTGSLTVCKVIADDGEVNDGIDYVGDSFEIDITGPNNFDETVTFETPLDLNTQVFQNGDEAQCVEFDNLPLGSYDYSEETIDGDGWAEPLYNDQYNQNVNTLDDFYAFDEDNVNSNGGVQLTSNKPDREIIILNQRQLDMVERGINTCTGEGELYLYQGIQTQPIATTFEVDRDQVLIFARAHASLSAKVNGANAPLTLEADEASPFAIKIWSIETSPGDVVEISGTADWNARSVQGYIAQDEANPVFDLSTLEVVYDDGDSNEMFLTPGEYSYVVFDKYTKHNGGGQDNRVLNVDVTGPSGSVYDDTFTQPLPVGTQGVVVDEFTVTESGSHVFSVETQDSVYWMNFECPEEELLCGDGEVNQEWETCDDGNNEDGDGCSAFCQEEVCDDIHIIDFEDLDAGEIVNTQISGVEIFCNNNNGPDECIVFDSANPTGQDEDLGTPNELYGGPGIGDAGASNQVAMDNILIVAEDVVDNNNDDLVDDPDDESQGGRFVFDFGDNVQLTEVVIVDIEETSGTISTDESDVNIPDTGDNSVQVHPLDDSTDSLVVILSGSGAVGRVAYCPLAFCGDGVVDDGEQCDDGNDNNDDECTNECNYTFCGDEIVQSPNGEGQGGPNDDGYEECDDGNFDNNDDCRNDCTVPFCGDYILDDGEDCDDGPNGSDQCTPECTFTFCGDGVVQDPNGLGQSEMCDDGNDNNNDACRNDCTYSICGDYIVDEGEDCDDGPNGSEQCDAQCLHTFCGDASVQSPNGEGTGGPLDDGYEACDDGNLAYDDACTPLCTKTFCGDDIIQSPNGNGQFEECEDGNAVDGDGCDHKCRIEECGNGRLDVGEECDDGNLVDGDGCSALCTVEECGNGIIDAGEECDDGNDDNFDECRNDCTAPFCGDGIQDDDEECDDGNDDNNDDCRNDCSAPFCGDGIKDDGEQCDDGNNVDDDGCSAECITEICGDGIVHPGEECDDGNDIDDDECTNSCTTTFCGDGVIQDPNGDGQSEVCDDGNNDSTNGCNNVCQLTFCGDGQVQSPNGLGVFEQCDDGNVDDFDGCDQQCQYEICGDGIVHPNLGEQCDDGNLDDNDGCSSSCQYEICGDGIQQPGEACDDGNDDNNDDCRNDCTVPICGDYIVDDGEDCDAGPQGNELCDAQCQYTFCGDGIPQDPNGLGESEQCDDGNLDNNDDCRNDCTVPYCGDEIVDAGEQCDDGPGGSATCDVNCMNTVCGDGVVQSPNGEGVFEVCDDGNTDNNDGCSSVCLPEECGDGIKQDNEQCDDGNDNNDDSCRNDCTIPMCGDGIHDVGEECDDGNDINDDECTNECTLTFCGDGEIQDPNSNGQSEVCDDGNNDGTNGCNNVCQFTFCGDGQVQTPNGLGVHEQCDDGNVDDFDGCDQQCQYEICGDGIVHPNLGEQCDDGNLDDNDGCSSSCQYEICGDGIQQPGEACDDGNDDNNDDCRNDCTVPFCGDYIVDEGEDCDVGPEPTDQCDAQCQHTFCGDASVQSPNGEGLGGPQNDGYEACDDGNLDSDDQCTPLCTETFCGDDIIQSPNGQGQFEQCEDGNAVDGDGCDHKCRIEECGNERLDVGEECDDGNLVDGDGCSAECTVEFCGDDILQEGLGEACDDGNNEDGDGCNAECQIEFCGDGILHPNLGEECDDGNNDNGDGCSAECTVEDICENSLDVMFVIDRSGSMSAPESKFQDAKDAAIAFVNSQNFAQDTSGVASFAQNASLDQPLTDNQAAVVAAINSLNANGPTALGDGILTGRTELNNGANKPIMIILSDGAPNVHPGGFCFVDPMNPTTCTEYALDQADLAKADDITVFTIGLGVNNFTEDLLKDVASTNDHYFFAPSSEELAAVYEEISNAACLCGNGELDEGEQCDGDAGVGPNQQCSASCTLEELTYCGDGIKQSPNDAGTGGPQNDGHEECDGQDGVGENQECSEQCTLVGLPFCGDNEVNQESEQCDDGLQGSSECTAECQLTYCGDEVVQAPNGYGQNEQCDDGNNDGTNGCNNVCQLTFCGDGTIQQPNGQGVVEQCDDGNVIDGDGCDQRCQIEEPPVCHADISAMLLIDRSGSMGSPIQKLIDAKNGAKAFVNAVDYTEGLVGVASFNNTATLDQGLSDDKVAIMNAINSLQAAGQTNLGDGVLVSSTELNGETNPVLIILSDGAPNTWPNGFCFVDPQSPNDCTNYALTQATDAKNNGVRIYAIGLGVNAFTEGLLTDMATDANHYYSTGDAADLEQIYMEIAEDACPEEPQ